MKYFLYVFIALFSIHSNASASRDEYLLQRQIQAVQHQNKVYGIKAVIARENVSISSQTQQKAGDLVRRSIAVDVPTASKVGTPTLARIKQFIKAPGASVLGVYAVTQLLEAIGWVMEDGTYVKKIRQTDGSDCLTDTQCEWEYSWNGKIYPTAQAVSSAFLSYENSKSSNLKHSYVSITLTNYSSTQISAVLKYQVTNVLNPNDKWINEQTFFGTLNTKYEKPKDNTKTVPLTPSMLGAAMLGAGYKDPDPDFNNDIVNTGDYTGVAETYEHDPNGVGNDLANDMDEKLKNAKPTSDGKSSYIGDPKYDQKPLTDGDTSADRSWESDAGESSGESKPVVDETGQSTGAQSISISFPVFCQWASSMCQWYDDWTASDKVHKDHMTKTEEHQTSEKSFWEKTKEWFDWTKEQPEELEETQQPEVDDQGIFTKTFDTAFSLSKQCPPDIPINFQSTYLTGSYTFSMNWLCIIFSFMAYPLVFLSHCLGMWILYEAVIQKEIKW